MGKPLQAVDDYSRFTKFTDLGLSPVALHIGPFDLRWYSLAYLTGIFVGYWYLLKMLKQPGAPMGRRHADDLVFYAALGVIFGGRLGYVLFYNLPLYAQNPLDAFKLWDGGMSFHGGLVGITVAMILFVRRRKGNVLSALDLLACVGPIGLFLGRVANFINGELYGRETTLPWGVIFPTGGPLPRHPSQLYEGLLEGVLLFLVLRVVSHVFHGLRRPGLAAGIFGMWYAVSRSLVELVRIPDPQLGYLFDGWITMGQILSVPVFLAGLGLVIYAMRKPARA